MFKQKNKQTGSIGLKALKPAVFLVGNEFRLCGFYSGTPFVSRTLPFYKITLSTVKNPMTKSWDFIKSFAQAFSKACRVLGQSPKVLWSYFLSENIYNLCINLVADNRTFCHKFSHTVAYFLNIFLIVN